MLSPADGVGVALGLTQLEHVAQPHRTQDVSRDDPSLVRSLLNAAFDLHGLAVHPGLADNLDHLGGGRVAGALFCAHGWLSELRDLLADVVDIVDGVTGVDDRGGGGADLEARGVADLVLGVDEDDRDAFLLGDSWSRWFLS
jgi:hypothetical protein